MPPLNPRLIPISHQNKRAWIYPEQGFQIHGFEQTMPNHVVAQVLRPVTMHMEPADRHFGNPILFPNPGAIIGPQGRNTWSWKDKIYPMSFHGFARNAYWHVLAYGSDFVTGELHTNPDTKLHYPFDFRCQATYRLSEAGLTLDFEVHNPGKEIFPYALGFHPYFCAPAGPKGSVGDCELQLPKGVRMESKDNFVSIEGKSWNETCIRADANLNGSILLTETRTISFHLKDHVNGWISTISTEGSEMDFPVWVIWSRTPDAPFLCIEPWTDLPNSLNRRETRTCPVNGSHHYRLTISIRPS